MEQVLEILFSLGYFKTQSLSSTFPSCLLFPRTLVKADVASELSNIMVQLFQIAHRLFFSSTILHLLAENIWVYFQMDFLSWKTW